MKEVVSKMICRSEERQGFENMKDKKHLETPGGKENAALECTWKCCIRKFLPITEDKIRLRYLSPFQIRIFLIAKQSNRAAERVCMRIDFAI